MLTLTINRLYFRSGIHAGEKGVKLEEASHRFPSDTLFSALLSAWRQLGGNPQEFCAPFLSTPGDLQPDPPFLITSSFPFAGRVLFFPMPADPAAVFSAGILKNRTKEIRDIRYLSLELLKKVMSGEKLDKFLYPEDETVEPEHGAALQNGSLLFDLREMDLLPKEMRRDTGKRWSLPRLEVWKESRTPRVTIDRVTSATTIYHIGRVRFAEDCGLWFGVNWRKKELPIAEDQPTYAEAFNHALAFLAEEGFGGERSSGYGCFTTGPVETVALENDEDMNGIGYLLSRCIPQGNEIEDMLTDERAAYQVRSVSGWLNSPDAPAQRRKKTTFITEGSFIPISDRTTGCVCEVKPEYENEVREFPHPVYRYGLGLSIRWPQKGGGNAGK